jgi:hypothetical protein
VGTGCHGDSGLWHRATRSFIKALEAGLSLLDDDGLKLTITVAGDTNLSLPKLPFDGLLAVAIAAVTGWLIAAFTFIQYTG